MGYSVAGIKNTLLKSETSEALGQFHNHCWSYFANAHTYMIHRLVSQITVN